VNRSRTRPSSASLVRWKSRRARPEASGLLAVDQQFGERGVSRLSSRPWMSVGLFARLPGLATSLRRHRVEVPMVGNAFQLMLASSSEGETGPGHKVLHRLKRGPSTAQLSRPQHRPQRPVLLAVDQELGEGDRPGRSMSLLSRSDLLGQNQHQECHGQSHQIRARSPAYPPAPDGLPRLERWSDSVGGRESPTATGPDQQSPGSNRRSGDTGWTSKAQVPGAKSMPSRTPLSGEPDAPQPPDPI
jgi:hypothetical protein